MTSQNDLLTISEAAAVAGVTVRDVNRVIDEHIVPEGLYSVKGGRWLKAGACTFVRFYFGAADKLTADERLHVIYTLSTAETRRWTYNEDFLTVHLEQFFEATQAAHDKLIQARELIIEDPEILGGTPIIRGTRVPVYDIAASIAAGVSPDRLKAAYPGLTETQIELATLYAEANPLRGRPRGAGAMSSDLRLITERKVRRRPRA
ncbi:MAG: DUF433 domain-containing protein [Caulobacteraceae bacterium]|nr:DUF433 domain-containing protein [Caulobacteraceae bacterium]